MLFSSPTDRCVRRLLLALLLVLLVCDRVNARVDIHNVSSYDEALSLIDNSRDRLLFLWDPLDVPSWKEYAYLHSLNTKESITVHAVSARSPFTSWLLAPIEAIAYPSYTAVFRNPNKPTPRFEKFDPNAMSTESFIHILHRFAK